MAFRVGQKVAYIGKGGWAARYGQPLNDAMPAFGRVYTVVGLVADGGREYLSFAETHPDHAYNALNFRPVVERKTDISIFTAMLTPKNVEVVA